MDKLLQASVEQYEALNAQLIEELPKLVRLVGEYIQAIVSVFASCQMQVYSDLSSTFAQIAHNLNDGVVDEWTSGHVIARYIQSTMENEALESAVRQVKLLAKFYAVCWRKLDLFHIFSRPT